MTTSEQIAYWVATDPAFRQSLEVDPLEAIASRGLALSATEAEAVCTLRQLLATSPYVLAAVILSLNGPTYWGTLPPTSV